jgi:hypothetical protein
MAIRTTVDIPVPLHDLLRQRAQQKGVSIRSLIVDAIEQTYQTREFDQAKKGAFVTGPLISMKGKRGPEFPVDENPHDHVFS